MKSKFHLAALLPVILCIAFNCHSQTANNLTAIPAVSYKWQNVQYTGGGFVDGIVFHPNTPGICYCRTDMGGAYRRDPNSMKWQPLLDWISYKDLNLMGVESIALDPSDPNRLYLSCGTYTNPLAPNGAILRSDDQGKTFARTDVPFKMGGNEDGRGSGERLAVDPANSKTLFLGTRHNGLWKSTDGAITWSPVLSFPDVSEKAPPNMKDQDSIARWYRMNRGSGIIFVLFGSDDSKKNKNSRNIYVGVSLMNTPGIFHSSDGGKTWQPVPGQPTNLRPVNAKLASNGTLFVTYGNSPGPSRMTNGAVWKLNTNSGKWQEITPDKPTFLREFGYAGVAVQHDNPDVVMVSSFNRYEVDDGEDIFRSLDGGKTWKQIFATGGIIDSRLAPYTAHTGIHWLFDLEIDPFDPNHAMFTTGYGGHETFNLTETDRGMNTCWLIMSQGIEETVPLELLSPPEGAPIITAIGDYGGAVHWDVKKKPDDNFSNPRFGNTNGIACAENKPCLIVRVGRATGDNPGKTIGYSTDYGKSWNPTVSLPHSSASLGHVAVSSNGTSWVWSPDPVTSGYGINRKSELLPVFVTRDCGTTWSKCEGIPPYTRVVADKVNDHIFYGMDLFNGKLYISNNGGFSFIEHIFTLPNGLPKRSRLRGDSRGGQDRLYATPGYEGKLWIAAFDGLYYSDNSGGHFHAISNVDEIHGFGFGKGVSDDLSSLYLIGTVHHIRGIFRSDNWGANWVRINDDQHQWGLLMHITGDPKKYGRVYVGTHGRGTVYGDPEISYRPE